MYVREHNSESDKKPEKNIATEKAMEDRLWQALADITGECTVPSPEIVWQESYG